MLWVLYNILFTAVFLCMLPRFLWRMKRRGGYARDFGQRLGRYRPDVRAQLAEGGRVWIHAVSVGEIFVALKFMDELRRRDPAIRFVLSTTTSTGYAIGTERIRDPDVLIYFPVDFPPVTRRVFRLIRPRALILVEGEFWPNLVRTASLRGVPLYLVNGRISARSYRGYRKLRVFTRRIFRLFDGLFVQEDADRDRLVDLGAPPETIRVMNSAKYDVAALDPDAEQAAHRVLEAAGFGADRVVLLGGSTWPGEEAILLDLYLDLRVRHPELALVLAPRHVERKDEVLAEVARRGLSVCLRSDIAPDAPRAETPDVLLVDTTGELMRFYACADMIFVGKSLCSTGGQNIIEPGLHGKPVVVGPHMGNFARVMEDFLSADAIRQVPDAEALKQTVQGWIEDPDARRAVGHRVAGLVGEKSGAVRETVARIVAGWTDDET